MGPGYVCLWTKQARSLALWNVRAHQRDRKLESNTHLLTLQLKWGSHPGGRDKKGRVHQTPVNFALWRTVRRLDLWTIASEGVKSMIWSWRCRQAIVLGFMSCGKEMGCESTSSGRPSEFPVAGVMIVLVTVQRMGCWRGDWKQGNLLILLEKIIVIWGG